MSCIVKKLSAIRDDFVNASSRLESKNAFNAVESIIDDVTELYDKINQIARERDELKSSNSVLRSALVDATNNPITIDTGDTMYALTYKADIALDKLPAESLESLKAEIGRDAILAAVKHIAPSGYGGQPDDPDPDFIVCWEICSEFQDFANNLTKSTEGSNG